MRYVTDKKWKSFKYRSEVPEKVLRSQFEHLSEDEQDGFFNYQNYWYHVSDFMRDIGFDGWDGAATDTLFSATVIKLSSDGESYKVGRVYS